MGQEGAGGVCGGGVVWMVVEGWNRGGGVRGGWGGGGGGRGWGGVGGEGEGGGGGGGVGSCKSEYRCSGGIDSHLDNSHIAC